MSPGRPRVVLICHHDAPLHLDGLARWVHAWADLRGILVIREPQARTWRRLRRERQRVGTMRLLDVLAYRLYHRVWLAKRDARWLAETLGDLQRQYPEPPVAPRLEVATPNSPEAQEFLERHEPTLMIALCKSLLAERIFSVPSHGTFVFHPGICPEYRNAHGCFWALASGDTARVGMTVLRIDRGIDTGPLFGWFRAPYDPRHDSHVVIQHRMITSNLTGIAALLEDIVDGRATPIPTAGRASREWGQPWLTAYLRWRHRPPARA